MQREDHSIAPHVRRPGRAAQSNEAGRYERHSRAYVSDGWDLREDAQLLRTDVSLERPRKMITYNRSPDLPFDRSINPYRGCEHGCIYCFARPSHAWLGLSAGLDFETKLVARPDAPQVLAQELARPNYKVAPIAIGTNTDPYQPIEQTHGIMRACLQVLSDFNHPVAIVTKGSLIERDLDILGDMAARGLARVGVSVTTLDRDLSRRMEPRVPEPARRLGTIAALAEAGLPVTPHCANLSLVTLFTMHLLRAIPHAGKYLEFSIEGADYYPWQDGLFVEDPFVIEAGCATVSDAPGWGIEVSPEWLAQAHYQVSEHTH